MQTDGIKFYSVITTIVIILVVVLVFAIRGLTRTIQVNVNDSAEPVVVEPTPDEVPTEVPVTPEPVEPTPTTDSDQTLIDSLQAIIDSKVILKAGSKGDQVGALQTFLNLYNNTTATVDKDFGPSLTTAVKAFQTKNGLPVTGQVAEKTIGKMIDWLKSN